MSERKPGQPNSSDELIDIRSLIRGADRGDYTVDEILSEYGLSSPPGERDGEDTPDLPWPEPPRRSHYADNVVAFPGGGPAEDGGGPEDEPPAPSAEEDAEAVLRQPSGEGPGEGPPEDKIIEFPEEESALGALLKDLKIRADNYADQMFAESERIDPEEIRRLEELIPGTDREDEAEENPAYDIRFHLPRWQQEPPPPDLPPKELARQYGTGLKALGLRRHAVAILALLALLQLLAPTLGADFPAPLDVYQTQALLSAGLLALGLLLGVDVAAQGFVRAFRLKFGMDTVTALACCFTLADALLLSLRQNRQGQLPYCAAALCALFLTMHGEYHRRCALRLSCRTAAVSSEPYLVTLDMGKWNGKDTYVKWSGEAEGFGSQIQMENGAQRAYRRVCPLLALACLVLALIASVGQGRPENLLWCLSANFTAAASFGGALVFARPFHKIAYRLSQSGAALAGWPGMLDSRRGDRLLVTDWDLFPPGSVELNGIKIFGDNSVERVVGYTATLIRDSGSGLGKLFHDLLRTQGAIFRRAQDLQYHEGGGVSAYIRDDRVLVGSAAFMNLMEIPLPQGLNVKTAVFCAINGELAGIFALNYSLPDVVFPALAALLSEKVAPVLATRDFNVIPAMLQQRFKLAANKMDFPPIERRRELSDPDQAHSATLTAVLCREGLAPFADAVLGARRLRRCTRLGSAICCVGSVLGLLLSYYLTSVAAYTSLSPLNLFIFLATWLLPVWFLTDWAVRY